MKTYIIAEAGVNHNGDINKAHMLIDQAKNAGADCVKFQTFRAENLLTKYAPKADYQLKVTDKNESQFDMLKSLELNYNDYIDLMSHAQKLKIDFMSTPYSFEDVDFLMKLNVDAFKIASGQLTELPFLDYVSKTKKPIFLSTGMSTMSDVRSAVDTISINSNAKLVIFQCTTNYPSLITEANINVIESFKSIPNIEVAYSDHVTNNYACFAAVAKGVFAIEKHFTLDNLLPGPDHLCSLDPKGFKELVNGIRQIEKSLGRILSKDIFSKINIPQYNCSAVDGYAIKYQDLEESENRMLKLIGKNSPGSIFKKTISKKSTIGIFTGAPIPDYYDTVVMFENCTVNDREISFPQDIVSGQNYRKKGEDIRLKSKVFNKGHVLKSQDLGQLAAIGLSKVSVFKTLRVYF